VEGRSDSSLFKSEVGDGVYLIVNTFQREIKVHVRKFETTRTGKLYATKRGICMPPKRFANFMFLEAEITRRVEAKLNGQAEKRQISFNEEGEITSLGEEWRRHIGGGQFVSICDEFERVDLRLFFKPEDSEGPIPTRLGVGIVLKNWSKLVEAMKHVRELYTPLKNAQTCFTGEDHQNQMGFFQCKECCPFGPDYSFNEKGLAKK